MMLLEMPLTCAQSEAGEIWSFSALFPASVSRSGSLETRWVSRCKEATPSLRPLQWSEVGYCPDAPHAESR